jgi:hypothetical protein
MHKIFLILIAAFLTKCTVAQDTTDLFKQLERESKVTDKNRTNYTSATFKTTRIINSHSVETTGKGILDFRISHRFGAFNEKGQLFGFDNAKMRLGFDYGLTSRLMIGAGRSSRNVWQKQYDGFAKYKLLRQSTGRVNMPVSVSFMSSILLQTDSRWKTDTIKRHSSDRLNYAFQLVVARKFSDNTSFQFAPTVVHQNIVPTKEQPNDIYALGIGGRQKISKRIALSAEYYYVFPDYKFPDTHNSLSLGIDIETGGHVFQMHFTNSTGMTELPMITQTQDQWSNGAIHFGFNISRVFNIGKKKKQKE